MSAVANGIASMPGSIITTATTTAITMATTAIASASRAMYSQLTGRSYPRAAYRTPLP